MAKVKMRKPYMMGPFGWLAQHDVVDLPEAVAASLVHNRYAVPVEEEPPVVRWSDSKTATKAKDRKTEEPPATSEVAGAGGKE